MSKEQLSNRDLLERNNHFFIKTREHEGEPVITCFREAIELNRPFKDASETFLALCCMSKVMAFMEQAYENLGCAGKWDERPQEDIDEGAKEILQLCRVISRRAEEFVSEITNKEQEEEFALWQAAKAAKAAEASDNMETSGDSPNSEFASFTDLAEMAKGD